MIFPLKDRRGYTYLLRARLWEEKSIWTISPKVARFPNLVFPKLKEIGAWFGMDLVDWSKPVVVVESELDVLRLASLGRMNVLASATSSVSEAQIKTVLMARRLILAYDADRAGSNTHRRIIDRADGKSNIYTADWSNAEKHELFRKGKKDDMRCKDAGDLKNEGELNKVLSNLKRA
jgi:DNA primase